MRRLHPRGAANRGICVDRDGAMLGPDCVLVGRTWHGFRSLEREQASTLQKCVFGAASDADWLFRQCQRISEALNSGEIALAQIHGLYIPIEKLDDRTLHRLSLVNVSKAGFNPDEPRIPKGEPHAGEWTTGGASEASADTSDGTSDGGSGGGDNGGDGGIDAGDAGNSTSSRTGDGTANDNLPVNLEIAPPAIAVSPHEPAMQYQILGTGSIAAANAAAAASLLNGLRPQVLAALAQLLARMTGPTAFFGILFIPSNGGLVVTGAVAGAPNLTVSYDRDTGVVRVWQADGTGGRALLDTGHIGTDGRLYNAAGTTIGAAIANGAIIDPDTLPGYRSQSEASTNANARAQTVAGAANEPKLCPDPSPDHPGARPENVIYQQYVSTLINGAPLPAGLAVSLWNPVTGKFVAFDDCNLSNGTMIDAKGPRYAYLLGYEPLRQNITEEFLTRAASQLQAAGGRQVEWHFAEQAAAGFARSLFEKHGIPIDVVYTPWRR